MNTFSITYAQNHQPIPQRKGLPVVGCLFDFAKDPLDFFKSLMLQGDDICEFSLPFTSSAIVFDADLTHQILVKELENFPKADREVSIMGTVLGNGLVTNNHFSSHKSHRKLVQPGFHFRRVQSYANTMSDYTAQMLSSWSAETRDISDDMFKLTMYIVCKTLFNVDMNELKEQADTIGETMDEVQECTNKRFASAINFPDYVPTPNNRRLIKARKKLDEIIEAMIATKTNESNTSTTAQNDMMSMLLEAEYEDGSKMSHTQVMDELITLFAAGHETTSNTLSWAFYLLSRHPEIQEKLIGEVDRVIEGDIASFENLNDLQYTEMVIKETLRIHPSVWTLSARQAKEDIELGGYFIPKGKTIFIAPYANHHNPKYFPKPDQFDPERFSTENEKNIPKHLYIPFGSGPRVCIGQSFAMMEAKIILASILKRFSIKAVTSKEATPLPQITLSIENGLKVELVERKH